MATSSDGQTDSAGEDGDDALAPDAEEEVVHDDAESEQDISNGLPGLLPLAPADIANGQQALVSGAPAWVSAIMRELGDIRDSLKKGEDASSQKTRKSKVGRRATWRDHLTAKALTTKGLEPVWCVRAARSCQYRFVCASLVCLYCMCFVRLSVFVGGDEAEVWSRWQSDPPVPRLPSGHVLWHW
jgi:hypothetical protein